jgi:hypothetical protein
LGYNRRGAEQSQQQQPLARDFYPGEGQDFDYI